LPSIGCCGNGTAHSSAIVGSQSQPWAACARTEFSGRCPGQLTIAGKKRLELARALSARPLLLLLDEVLAGLNPAEVERMIDVIRSIRERGVAILMIEHLMQAIMSLSDRIVVLSSGRKLAEGLPAEVANDPAVIEAYLGNPEHAARLRGAA